MTRKNSQSKIEKYIDQFIKFSEEEKQVILNRLLEINSSKDEVEEQDIFDVMLVNGVGTQTSIISNKVLGFINVNPGLTAKEIDRKFRVTEFLSGQKRNSIKNIVSKLKTDKNIIVIDDRFYVK